MPDFTNLLQNGMSSLTGKIEKAVVKVQDTRPADPNEVERLEAIKTGGASKKQMDKLKKDKKYNKMFQVQFNPSTMQISGYGGRSVAVANYNNTSNKELSVKKPDINMQFSVRLIFDQMILAEAFPSHNFNLNASRALEVAGGLVNKVVGNGGVDNVQTIVEGFIAALRSPYTANVAFCWGKMTYAGVLQSVNANYTLFDATSKPVRAEVDLSIYLRDHNIKTTESGYDLGYWQEAYKAAFEKSHSFSNKGSWTNIF